MQDLLSDACHQFAEIPAHETPSDRFTCCMSGNLPMFDWRHCLEVNMMGDFICSRAREELSYSSLQHPPPMSAVSNLLSARFKKTAAPIDELSTDLDTPAFGPS